MKKAKYRISLILSISLMASLSNTTVFNKIQAANNSNVYASTLSSTINVSSVTLNKTTDTLTVGDTDTLTSTVAPDNATNKSVTWTSSDSKIATVSNTGVVTAVSAGTASITATTADGSNKTASCNVTVNNPGIGVTYDAHVQNIGWQTPWAKNGSEAGTEGKSFRIEALKINLTNAPAGASISYQTHIQNIGWQDYKLNGDISGTTGKELKIEAIKIKLQNMPGYSVAYQAYIQNIGWQDWKYDDNAAGTTGKSLRIEALRVKIVPTVNASSVSLNKTTDTLTVGDTDTLTSAVAPDNATNKSVTWTSSDSKIATVSNTGVVTAVSAGTASITAATADGSNKTASCNVTVNNPGIGVTYDAHVQNIGWQTPWAKNGSEAGTEGKSFRIEALKINLTNAPADASISYQTHIQNIGWQDYKLNGDISGTTGKELKIEAIKIKLQNMPGYSVAYQAYIQNIGWQDWKYDDDAAGTTGKSLRIEALRVKIVPKQNINVSNEIGNTNSNLANTGLAAEKNNWIYYSDISHKTLNKVSKDGTTKQVLVNKAVTNINIVGDWIYYTDENSNAYKVKTDGTSETDLKISNVLQMNVVGDWIYYIPTANDSDDYSNEIYKIKTDGTSKSTITTNKVLKYAVENGWVYYVKLEDITIADNPDTVGKLYKIKTDGTSDTLVCDSFIDPVTPSITVENGCIYYKSAYLPADDAYKPFASYADNTLYKINVDGTGKKALKAFGDTILKFTNLNVANGWVYYSLYDNQAIQPSFYTENTYKLKTDGTGEVNFVSINDKIIAGINIVDDWIFGNLQSTKSYGDWGQTFNFPMKMKTDGSNFDYYDNNICSHITGSQDNNLLYKDFYYSNWNVNVNSVEPIKLAGTSSDDIKDLVTTSNGHYYLKKSSIYATYYSLYKSSTDGTGEIKLSDDVEQFAITNNTIVYSFESDYEFNLYKMNLDGSAKTKLSNNNVDPYMNKFIIQNDSVYYNVNNSQYPDISGIYKTSISSPSDIKVISGLCTNLFIKGNNIFYNKASGNIQNQLWKANMDGTSATPLDSNITLVDYATISDSVFYTKGSSLYKLNINTNNIIKLVDASPYTIKITPNYILYNPAPGSSTLYKANIDGTSIVKLCDNGEVAFGVTVVGDWVYYAGTLLNQQSDDEARYVFKVKLDGTSGQQTAIRDINKFYNFTN